MKPVRVEYRLTLAHLDRGIDLSEVLVVSHHPTESQEHLTLRVLAYCLLHQPGITLGPGDQERDAPDLLAVDLTGALVLWIRCGEISLDGLRKVVQHNRGAAIHLVFSDGAARGQLKERMASLAQPPRGWGEVTLWNLDSAVVQVLASAHQPRQRWTVTIVGDHLYVDAGEMSVDGPVTRT